MMVGVKPVRGFEIRNRPRRASGLQEGLGERTVGGEIAGLS